MQAQNPGPESPLAPGLALIFDMDGVIVDSNPVHRRAWAEFNRRYGLETTDAMQERMYGRRNDEIVRDFFGPDLSVEEIAARGLSKEALYRDILSSGVEEILVPGVRQFLTRYRGVPQALATNAEPENVQFVLDQAQLRNYFRVVVDGRQVRNPKPHPDIYLCAAIRLGVAPANCIVFEDSPTGVEAARAAGARVVGILTTYDNLNHTHLKVDNFLSGVLTSWLADQSVAD
jgi:beta-phosphoglucomutase